MSSSLCIVFLLGFILHPVASSSWEKAKREIRLPLELRIINEGLAHDKSHWYLSNKHILYKTTSVEPLRIELSNVNAIPEDLRVRGYNHIGDIDMMIDTNQVIGGLEGGSDGGLLARWNATDLSLLQTAPTGMKGCPWLAVDYSHRMIYTADWSECCVLHKYDVDTFEYIGNYTMPAGVNLPKEVQGGAFFNDDLYLAINSNDEVWKLVLDTSELTLEVSDDYNKHDYEMEGITFWDLEEEGLGTMHMFGNFMEVKEKSIHSYSFSSPSPSRDMESTSVPITVGIYCDEQCTQLGCELPNQSISNPFNTATGECTVVASDGYAILWDTCDASSNTLYFYMYPEGCSGYEGTVWYPVPNTCIRIENGDNPVYAFVKC